MKQIMVAAAILFASNAFSQSTIVTDISGQTIKVCQVVCTELGCRVICY